MHAPSPTATLARPFAAAMAISVAAWVSLLAVSLAVGLAGHAPTSTACSACGGVYAPPPGVTVPFDTRYATGSDDIPLDDPRVEPPPHAAAGAPDQIFLTLAPGGAIVAHWASADADAGVAPGLAPPAAGRPPPADPAHGVRHGAAPDALTAADAESGGAPPTRYAQRYRAASYVSPTFHHVPLAGVAPGSPTYFAVGSDATGWSTPRGPFVAPAAGAFPFMLAVVGDTGQTANTTSTLDHIRHVPDPPGALLHVGDFSYADLYGPTGRAPSPGDPAASYGPRWDAFVRLLSPVASRAPLIPTPGNHERERDATGAEWQAYSARFFAGGAAAGGGGGGGGRGRYYAVDAGPVHVLVLDSYAPDMAAQAAWAAADVAAVDRAVTPWVVAAMHAPWYSSSAAHYREAECVRAALEPALAGVDAFFAGHVHSYERTHRVAAHAATACGAPHVTVGDGGNAERLYTTYADGPAVPTTQAARGGGCPPRARADGDACASRAPGPYCHPGQPRWSAYREPSFGFGTLTVESATRAVWTWHRNQDGARVAADRAVWGRGDGACGIEG